MDPNNSDQNQKDYPANQPPTIASQQDSSQTQSPNDNSTQRVPLESPHFATPTDITANQADGTIAQTKDEDYIEDLGGDLIDFLDDMEANENLLQNIANDMGIEKEKARTILSTLLDKIDHEQISIEELALIISAIGAGAITEE